MYASFLYFLKRIVFVKRHVWFFRIYIAEDRMETTPQFFDLNLKLNYTFVLHDHIKFQLNTGVQNIFNSFQKDLDKGEFRDAGYFYGPTQPRTFFIGFKIMN